MYLNSCMKNQISISVAPYVLTIGARTINPSDATAVLDVLALDPRGLTLAAPDALGSKNDGLLPLVLRAEVLTPEVVRPELPELSRVLQGLIEAPLQSLTAGVLPLGLRALIKGLSTTWGVYKYDHSAGLQYYVTCYRA